MVFITYLQFSIPIFIQNVTEFGETETKLLVAFTSIWKTLSSIDQHTVILSWHSKVEDILRPLRTSDFVSKSFPKKTINDRYIELLQMRWFTADTKISFRLGHNQTITTRKSKPYLHFG